MIRTIIIDDEPLARSVVKEMLQAHGTVEVVAECGDGFEGLKAISSHKPDLVFLDIQMPRITGFEMLELVEQPPAIIFTTAYDEFAMKAFEAHAVDYLLKPFSRERFDRSLLKFLDNGLSQEVKGALAPLANAVASARPCDRIVVKAGTRIHIIPIDTVQYIEGADDYVKIHTPDGHFLKNNTMSLLEASLDGALFVRVHRSFIVHIREITRIDPYEKEGHLALLRSGARIPVSKSGYARLKTVLGL